MMDWTDRHCRRFHRVLSPNARLYTEMVHANAVLRGDRERLLGYSVEERPLALQLGGSEPELLAEATAIAESEGYSEVNLNVGCPSDRVQSGRFGACLMREPERVAECVAAMQARVSIPVTVKCRIGVDDQVPEVALYALVDACAQAGCRVFIVHARKAWLEGLSPRENRDVPPLDYSLVRALKRDRPHLTIVLNGGLVSSQQAVVESTDLDGVMLGRAAYHTPYVLHELDRALFGGAYVSRADLLDVYQSYFEQRLSLGEPAAHMTRHVLGLFHGQPGGRAFRRVLSTEAHRHPSDPELLRRACPSIEREDEAA